MKKIYLILAVIMLVNLNNAFTQVSKTIHVDTAGTLYSLLTAEDLALITDLTITGKINQDDYNTMKSLMPSLKALDLSQVQSAGDSIYGEAFKYDLTSLILPLSLTRIGNRALFQCDSLTHISIPPLVTSIGENGLAFCSSLTSVTLPESVMAIGNYAFAGCRNLLSIDLPEQLNRLGQVVFSGCDSLSYIHIPPGLTELPDLALAGSSGLDSIDLGSSLKTIGTNALAGCINLKSLVIPASVDSIAPYAFVGCQALTTVNIQSASRTYLGEGAFAGNTNLKTVTIHESEGISLGRAAFVNCINLETFVMAEQSVTSIGEACFLGNSIDTLIFPASLKSIDKYAFQNCDSLRSVAFLPSSGISLGENAFNNCSNLASVNMNASSVDSIGLYCFIYCEKLTDLILPASLIYIADNAFKYCHIEGTLIMPSSLKYIGQFAFYSQFVDTLIFMPSPGTKLGDNSFAGSPTLASIVMYSPSVDSIGPRCFSGCPNLKNVVLPSSLMDMQYGAFGWCNQLDWFRINSTVPPVINKTVFPYWSGGVVDLYVPSGTKDAYEASPFWSWFNTIDFEMHLSADPDTMKIADTSATYDLGINASVNWQALSDQPWVSIYPDFGLDSAIINLSIEANPDTAFRTAIVILAGINVPGDTLVIIQDPRPVLSLSASAMNIGWHEGDTIHFTIISNQEWTLECDQSWLMPDITSGKGSADILLTVTANPDTMTRQAVITVSTARLVPETIFITQAPARILTVDPAELEIGSAAGSTAEFHITSNLEWTILSGESWLTVNPSSGTGTMDVAITTAANPALNTRSAVITVSAEDVQAQAITVVQEAATPTGLVEPSEDAVILYPNPFRSMLSIDHAAGSEIVLFDMKGKILLIHNLKDNSETIDLSFLPQGEYLVKIADRLIKVTKVK